MQFHAIKQVQNCPIWIPSCRIEEADLSVYMAFYNDLFSKLRANLWLPRKTNY